MLRFDWAESPSVPPPFSDIDVRVAPDGDKWRLSLVGMPDNEVIATECFDLDEQDLAMARGNDLGKLIGKYWPKVRVHRRYQRD